MGVSIKKTCLINNQIERATGEGEEGGMKEERKNVLEALKEGSHCRKRAYLKYLRHDPTKLKFNPT